MDEWMREATSVYLLITECTCLCRFRRLGRDLVSTWLAKRTGFGGKSRFHVAVTIIRCWWLKDLLEALLGGRSMLKVKRGGGWQNGIRSEKFLRRDLKLYSQKA